MGTDVQQATDMPNPGAAGSAQGGRGRVLRLILLSVLVSLLALRVLYRSGPVDSACEWTLRFPGTPPGATFKTKPGDDIRRMLEILRADSGADWRGPLVAAGSIEVVLSYHEIPSFWRRLSWGLRLPKGTLGPDSTVVLLSILRVDRISSEPVRYKVTHFRDAGDETVAGTFDSYQGAEQAVLDELARVMEAFQANRKS